jgi:PHD/YefM family antitoxin component YafN of YafNO toxin-antitoxin module
VEEMSIEEARRKLGDLVPPKSNEPTVIKRYDLPVAIIVPLAQYQALVAELEELNSNGGPAK